MEHEESGWWQRHGWTVALLLTSFALAFLIRTIWQYPIIAKWGPLYTYAGGSDSYYHSRVMSYIIMTGHNLVHDPMLKYPLGGTNPREPLFDWMNAILGILFAPFFGGNAVVAGAWFLDLQGPLWAALEVFPLYLIGREVSSKRTGLIAAMILPFLSASIDSSTFGYANYLSFYTFMILVVVYSYIRTLKALGTHRYIESYAKPETFWPALKAFYHREHTAVKWSVFTGVSLGALALSWQGYTYAIVVIGVGLLVAMIIERIRKVDSFGLYVSTWIIGLVAIPMMTPYYFVQGDLKTFFDLPVLLLFGVLALMLPFLLMRDIPWVFSIPALVGLVGLSALFLQVFEPHYLTDIVTGQGYFVKTLIYSTVAEAQPPSFDALVVGYGVFTFFLAYFGLAIFVYLLARHKFKRYHIALLVYGVVSLYLPISATKFFLVGSPAYALLAAESLHRALDVGSYPTLRRTVASLSDRGSQVAAFRRAFKARHAIVLLVIVAMVLPNVWFAIDAGIPGNTKSGIADQINNSIPSWLKLNASEPAGNYLGATGTSLDTPNQYDSAAYTWLSHQDTNVPEPQRPAFVSWWDYGFQAIDQGLHPSVADNFQNGIDPAGQFLLAQNESLAIAVLATALLSAELTTTHSSHLPAPLQAMLAGQGVDVAKLEGLLTNTAADYTTVVSHPDIYLPVNPNTITDDNAMYLTASYYLAGALSLTRVAQVYDDVQEYTGWSIRYAMVDSRLFPFSGSDTGIFYAPADLTGRVIDSEGMPSTFFNVTVLASNNETYPLGSVPSGLASEQYEINYFAPFYNSFLYRTYIGYNGTDVGQAGGIPGLGGAAETDRLEPGWMLQHFQIVYRTAYYCAGVKNASNSSGCRLAANYPYAKEQAKKTNGTFDGSAVAYFQGGETMLAYYPGQTLVGTVTSNGRPDGGIHVTVYDGWGIPHMTAVTSANGTFTLVLPPGNDTLNFTTGTFNKMTQAGDNLLRSVKLVVQDSLGYSFDAPSLVQTYSLTSGSLRGTVYWNNANNSSKYVPQTDPVIAGATISFGTADNTSVLSATTDASGSYLLPNVPPANYSVSVRYLGHSYSAGAVLVKPGEAANASAGLTPASIAGTVTQAGGTGYAGAVVTISDASGRVARMTTPSSGAYKFASLAIGNYTVRATVPGSLLRSPATPTTVSTAGQSVTVPLSLVSMGSVAIQVTDAGSPVIGASVRLSPILTFAAAANGGLSAVNQVLTNGTVAVTGSGGVATATVPVGNYSVYVLGYVGGSLAAGLGRVTTGAAGQVASVAIDLTPAMLFTGIVSPGTASNTSGALVAYLSSGASELVARTASNATFALELPKGSYDLLALDGTTGSTATTSVELEQFNLTATAALGFLPTSATTAHLSVFANSTKDTTLAVGNATATITEGVNGPRVTQTAGPNGSLTFYLPTSVPLASGGYCLAASAPGYIANTTCGLSAKTLSTMSVYRLNPKPVPVTLTVSGLPAGTSVLLNVTSKSATAVSRYYSGGPRFSTQLEPGTYSITAYASVSGGGTLYEPAAPLKVRVPFASAPVAVTVPVLPQILARGTLSLPHGTAAANTTVVLRASSLETRTVNGTAFLAGFRIAPGNYTAVSNATGDTGKTNNLTAVTVSSTGAITPRVVLVRPGVKLTGTIVSATTRKTLAFNGTLVLSSATGVTVDANLSSGSFSASLPADRNFSASANLTVRATGTNGSIYRTWTVVAGTTCPVGTSAATCTVPMESVVDRSWVNGTVELASLGTITPATVRVVGPYPSTNVSQVAAPNGTFSLHLVPGSYALYATPTSGGAFAGFASALAAAGGAGHVSVALIPAETARISVVASGAADQTVGTATLVVGATGGNRVAFSGISPGSSLNVLLPAGGYLLRATAPGTLGGIASTATGKSSVTIASTGNLAVAVTLAVPEHPVAVGALVGPRTANVTVQGRIGYASFAYSVRDTGNVPETVHLVGSPAYWTFNFSAANVSLTPGGSAVSGDVRVGIPASTVVDHPPVAISFQLENGTSVGNVTPAPKVVVGSYEGVKIAHSTSKTTGLGATEAQVPLHVRNSGNVQESIALTLTDAARLAGIGWTYSFGGSGANHSARTINVSAETNASVELNLTFTGTHFITPGEATVEATVLNTTHPPTASVTVKVPITKVTVSTSSGSSVTVTGPGVGPAQTVIPDWELAVFALLPGGLLLALFIGRRWWKTRRWSKW